MLDYQCRGWDSFLDFCSTCAPTAQSAVSPHKFVDRTLYARPLVVTILYHVLTWPLNRIGPSRRLVPLSGMAFLSNCALFHVIFRARFIVSLRPFFLPGPGLGALLSSYLEGALYKFHR